LFCFALLSYKVERTSLGTWLHKFMDVTCDDMRLHGKIRCSVSRKDTVPAVELQKKLATKRNKGSAEHVRKFRFSFSEKLSTFRFESFLRPIYQSSFPNLRTTIRLGITKLYVTYLLSMFSTISELGTRHLVSLS
jgi:hypothetical protein